MVESRSDYRQMQAFQITGRLPVSELAESLIDDAATLPPFCFSATFEIRPNNLGT